MLEARVSTAYDCSHVQDVCTVKYPDHEIGQSTPAQTRHDLGQDPPELDVLLPIRALRVLAIWHDLGSGQRVVTPPPAHCLWGTPAPFVSLIVGGLLNVHMPHYTLHTPLVTNRHRPPPHPSAATVSRAASLVGLGWIRVGLGE